MISTISNDRRFAFELLDRFSRPLPTDPPSKWCEENIVFDDPEVKGPISFTGREYLRQVIDDINEDSVHDMTLCWATGMAKTLALMAMGGWKFEHEPFRGLWVMPTTEGEGGAREFSTSRFQKMLKKSKCFAKQVQNGKLNSLNVKMGGTVIGFVGANSPGQLSSNRCSLVIQDEKDKFKTQLNKEAGAGYLANERTKNVPHAKRIGTSTPTIEDGQIWQDLMASDLRRRFLACPHCNPSGTFTSDLKGRFVLVRSEQFTVLPSKLPDGTRIPLAQLRWDDEAKRSDGTWDMDRVIRSTRFECPHCGRHIVDDHRIKLDKSGLWVPTKRGSPFHVGYQLAAFYAPWRDFDSSWGGMAKKFLDAQEASMGMRGIINSDYAEVDAAQEHGKNAIEVGDRPVSQVDWVPQLTADFQKNWPYIWFVVRKWCAFKLIPPVTIEELKAAVSGPENVEAKRICDSLVAGCDSAWDAVAELMRFDSRTGRSPIVDFLLQKQIVGGKLTKLFRNAGGTLKFREVIYKEMGMDRPPRGGDSELVAAGHLALSGEYVWEELKDVVKHFEIGKGMAIPNRCVAIDAGYAEKFNREVLRKCYESATEWKFYDPMSKNRPALFYRNPIHNFCQRAPLDGWLAMKGYPINQRWNHGGVKNELNMNIEDPFFGTPNAGESVCEVLEFPSGLFWLRKDDLRQKRTNQTYIVSPEVSWYPKIHKLDGVATGESSFRKEDYEKQLNEQYYDEEKGQVLPRHGKGGMQGRRHPFHLDDCEAMQIALASYNEFFDDKQEGKK